MESTDVSPIAELTMPFPFGVCFFEDPNSPGEVPPIERSEQSVAVARTAVAVAILHEVDGEASARLLRAPFESGGVLVFAGPIESDSGELCISDAAGEHQSRVHVGPGVHEIRIFVDRIEHPELVEIVIGTRA